MAASSDRVPSAILSTKELAKSLGLVSKWSSSKKSQISKRQPFANLVVIDFESTCWKEKKMNYAPEIIEFPAVLVNTSTGGIESEFRQYVMPSEHQRLSEFCTELTGITQARVAAGVPIGTCLLLFNRWLQELQDQKGIKFISDVLSPKTGQHVEGEVKWCTFVTWSDWDIGICLKNECLRKRHRVPPALRSWIDLKATYKTFYKRKPNGLAGALKDLGIQFSGREHSGLDDARNTAKLAWRMIRDGCVMNVTGSIDASVATLHRIILNGFKTDQASDARNNNQKPSGFDYQLLQTLSNRSHASKATRKNSKDAQSKIYSKLDNNSSISSREATRALGKSNVERTRCQEVSNSVNVHGKWTSASENLNEGIPLANTEREDSSKSVRSLIVPNVSVSCISDKRNDGRNTCMIEERHTKCLVSPLTCLADSSDNSSTKTRASVGLVSRLAVESTGMCTSLKRRSTEDFTAVVAKRGLAKQSLIVPPVIITKENSSQGNYRRRALGLKRSFVPHEIASSSFKRSNIEPRASSVPIPKLLDSTNLLDYKTACTSACSSAFVTDKGNSKCLVTPSIEKSNENLCSTIVQLGAKYGTSSKSDLRALSASAMKPSKPGGPGEVTQSALANGGKAIVCNVRAVTLSLVGDRNGNVTLSSARASNENVTPLSSTHARNANVTQHFSAKTVKSGNGLARPISSYFSNGTVTPLSLPRFNGGNVTPPLCHCGRRAKRLTVMKPGPNQGRVFYACPVNKKRSSFGRTPVSNKKTASGCGFFHWEPESTKTGSAHIKMGHVRRTNSFVGQQCFIKPPAPT